MKRDFEDIISGLKETIASYKYFVDFDKVLSNSFKMKNLLNLMNKLIGTKDNFDVEFTKMVKEYPDIVSCIPPLIAYRMKSGIISIIDNECPIYYFDNAKNSIEDYIKFLSKTGLKKIIANGLIHDLNDYLIGIEVGLDSNARKNRTGTEMEKIVYEYLSSYKELRVIEQASKVDIEREFGFTGLKDFGELGTSENNKANKRFDFAVKYNNLVYLIETNFYSSGGSKLNETARSYEMLADELKKIPGCKFIWITDGKGWISARNNLLESYKHQDNLLTLEDLENDNLIKLIRDYTNS